MKIFLTGSTGFLGKSIMQFLKEHEYFCYQRGTDIFAMLNSFKPHVIIHSAGEIYNELEMYKSNVLLTNDILQWVSKNNITKMIYFGSSSEYGITNNAMSEHNECIPVSMYALTKLTGTQNCLKYAKQYEKDICVIRPFSVFGINEPEKRLIPTLLKNLKNKQQITLIKGNHDFIYIKDFVRCVELAIASNCTKGEIFNAGSGQTYSNIDVLDKMKKILSIKDCKVEYLDKVKACDSQMWQCDTTKSKNVLGFTCNFTIDSGLEEYTYMHGN